MAEPATLSSDLVTSLAEAARTLTEPLAAFEAIAWASSVQLAEVPSAFMALFASFASRCSSLTIPLVQLGSCLVVLAFTTLGSWQTKVLFAS